MEKRPKENQAVRIGRFPVYCTCRKPKSGSLMVECAICHEWFHLQCIDLGEEDLPNNDLLCSPCQKARRTKPVLL